MGRSKCSICQHERRTEIDEALVRGVAVAKVAADFGCGRMSVWRHANDNHVVKTIAQAHQVAEATRADDLLGQLRALQARALGLLTRAERKGDIRAAAGAIREARGCLELLGRLAGELQDGVTVNVAVLPEWQTLRGRILVALEPYNEAREAVVKALEGGDAP